MDYIYYTMWMSKYALTKGVQRVEARQLGNSDYYKVNGFPVLKLGLNIFSTQKEAFAKAETLRQNKIASLCRKLDKLEDLDFTEPKS